MHILFTTVLQYQSVCIDSSKERRLVAMVAYSEMSYMCVCVCVCVLNEVSEWYCVISV